MTLAEAVTLSARLRSLYEYGDSEEGPGLYAGDSWYEPYGRLPEGPGGHRHGV